jgi:hypothetical protein
VTERELNRALLARQMLLERVDAPLPRVVESMGLLQAQYAPSMYIGLWSRMRGFSRADLDRALAARSVVQATLLRVTIHLASREDFWPVALAIREARRTLWLRLRTDLTVEAMIGAADRLRAAFADADGGTLQRKEIEALLGRPADAVGAWLDLVRVPPSGTWVHRRAHTYGLAEDWVGPPTEPDAGLLVRRYLGAFGPARPREIADWAGLRVGDLDLAGVERRDGGLVDLPGLPLPDPETPAPVRFLPTYDAILLAHARRANVLPEEHRSRVFNIKMPQSIPTFLVDGQVAGTWKYADGRVVCSPFGKLDAAVRRELSDEAERLAALHA